MVWYTQHKHKQIKRFVLILVAVDDGLVQTRNFTADEIAQVVLILVAVDDGLVLDLIRHY